MREILDVIHKTIYQFFDVYGEDEEVPMSDKDKLLLEVNKAICNNLKVLEQEPTTKNDLGVDCISRADAIKAMQDKSKRLTNEDTINGLCGAVAILFDLPSVTPQKPKTGHWIMTGDYYTGAYDCIDYVKCSCCGEDSLEEGNFCPNCGADMRGNENDNT